MASRRMIDPAFWQSETIASYPLPIRYFFIGLFSNADDQGRLRAHPALLRSIIYPYDDISLDEIQEMVASISADGGPILVYQSEGRELIQILNWWRWQRPSWSWPSELEPPPGWEDRLCYRRGNTVIKENWDQSEATVGPEWDHSETEASKAPSDSISISTSDSISGSTSDSGSISMADAAVADALESIDMGQIPTVIKEATRAGLTARQVIDTCAWAKENGREPGLVRAMFRKGEAHQPRAPDNGNKLPWTCPTCGSRPCECEEPMELRNS